MSNALQDALSEELDHKSDPLSEVRIKDTQIRNGFRTCAPLIAAALKNKYYDVHETLEDMLLITRNLSESIFDRLEQHNTINESDKAVIRHLIVYTVSQYYQFDRYEELHDETTLDVLCNALTYPHVCAEFRIQRTPNATPLLLVRIEMLITLSGLFNYDITKAKALWVQLNKELEQTIGKLESTINDKHVIGEVLKIITEKSIDMYVAIFESEKQERNIKLSGQVDISHLPPIEDISMKKFTVAIKQLVDTLLITSDFTK